VVEAVMAHMDVAVAEVAVASAVEVKVVAAVMES
jgi:hypothetical protein